jgi:WD repeat-containing protein 35
VLVTAVEPEDTGVDPLSAPASVGATGTPAASQYILILCNAIGSPVDSKYIDVRPDFVTMTPYHIVVASTDTLYIWQYRTAVSKLTSLDAGAPSLRRKEGRERVFHIDDANTGEITAAVADAPLTSRSSRSLLTGLKEAPAATPISDAICCVTASTKYLLVGRESGTVQQYSLPLVALENKFTLRCRPVTMQLNCDSTKFAIIDINNVLSLFDLEARNVDATGATVQGEHLAFERKDVWVRNLYAPAAARLQYRLIILHITRLQQVMWADDYPNLWAVMEKTRMYVFRDTDPEEPTLR